MSRNFWSKLRASRLKTQAAVRPEARAHAEALEPRRLLATVATITNGIVGDNSFLLTVDAYGSYGFAYINNNDPGTLASDTLFDAPGTSPLEGTTRLSGLYLGGPVNHFLTSNNNLDPNALAPTTITNASPSTAVSNFVVNGINVALSQSVVPAA